MEAIFTFSNAAHIPKKNFKKIKMINEQYILISNIAIIYKPAPLTGLFKYENLKYL